MKKYIFLVLTLMTMGIIFYFSSQPYNVSKNVSDCVMKSASQYTFFGKLFGFVTIRKCVHFLVYFFLGIFMFGFVRCWNKCIMPPQILAMIFCFLYACSDEIHQLFVLGRSGEFGDVMLDTCGSIMGVLLFILILFIKKRINNKLLKR